LFIILILVLGYILIGLVVDVWVHLSNPIVYWDARDALKGHVSLTAVWPVVVVSLLLASR
jgi:hypothetical protein